MHAWHQLTDQNLGKRLLTFILLGTMVLWGAGITISVPNFKDTSVPFMCQDHACSCRNAGNCWNHCCCFSRSEKLAWAQKNKVQPPEQFLAELKKTSDTSSEFCGEPTLKPDVYAALCTLRGTNKSKKLLPATCSGGSCSSSGSQPNEAPASRPFSLTNAMQCHALASVTLIYSPVLELDMGTGQLAALNVEAMPGDSNLRPTSFSAAPDPPPPRA
ncbi:hypothetical protein C5Y96_12725 [Blastopirellula marina]|uniref:Uncharacterized protein n=1 Tax=Blastopirellula marina TaxID=124 RepID=A0A2S8FGA0_9BACT|nr:MULTISPECIES: hypothetical protein [Pirellulaceae]PQO31205.1 hypothetical protein C5Y96_12725 [Blastopirellula marina]RCS51599.1 hypothetical protein DTL36_12735 [Bremerella cremea]